MAKARFPEDFREFLKLLSEHEAKYLLIDGYAVGYHGFPRTTLDMDVWVAADPENARKMVNVMVDFGFSQESVSLDLFTDPKGMIRMGVPPLRLEVLKEIDGVSFEDCYQRRIVEILDEVEVSIISLRDLRKNKEASGRHKDIADLENLPEV